MYTCKVFIGDWIKIWIVNIYGVFIHEWKSLWIQYLWTEIKLHSNSAFLCQSGIISLSFNIKVEYKSCKISSEKNPRSHIFYISKSHIVNICAFLRNVLRNVSFVHKCGFCSQTVQYLQSFQFNNKFAKTRLEKFKCNICNSKFACILTRSINYVQEGKKKKCFNGTYWNGFQLITISWNYWILKYKKQKDWKHFFFIFL